MAIIGPSHPESRGNPESRGYPRSQSLLQTQTIYYQAIWVGVGVRGCMGVRMCVRVCWGNARAREIGRAHV